MRSEKGKPLGLPFFMPAISAYQTPSSTRTIAGSPHPYGQGKPLLSIPIGNSPLYFLESTLMHNEMNRW